jgi:hypothetical protein
MHCAMVLTLSAYYMKMCTVQGGTCTLCVGTRIDIFKLIRDTGYRVHGESAACMYKNYSTSTVLAIFGTDLDIQMFPTGTD